MRALFSGEIMRKTVLVLTAITLGYVTSAIIGIARDAFPGPIAVVLDLFFLPGALLGLVIAPGGVHGGRINLWIISTIVGNALFYGALWLLFLRMVLRRRSLLTPKDSDRPRPDSDR